MSDLARHVEQEMRLAEQHAEELAEAERAAAYRAVNLALQNYRWWGLTNLLRRVRMFWTRYKFQRAMDKWFKRYPDGCLNMSDEDTHEANRYARKLGL